MTEQFIEYDTITPEQMERWFNSNKNVLIYGDHGVGKTSIIKNYWDSIGIKYQIFSGATLDPWVDIIGIPKLVTRNREKVLEFARPKNMDENLEAIFIDEYNRSHPQVRNALLELKQFKTINGRSFPKLKVVWAAANPKDTENNYDVDELDPAQQDRFHIIIKLANKVNFDYFSKKYNPIVAKSAVDWYNNIDPSQKSFLSPRRVDYAIEHFLSGGEIRECIPNKNINVSTLIKGLVGNSEFSIFKAAVDSNNLSVIKSFLSDQKKYQSVLKESLQDADCCKAIVKYADPELSLSLAESEERIAMFLQKEISTNRSISDAFNDIKKARGNNPAWYENSFDLLFHIRAAKDDFESKISILSQAKTFVEVKDIQSAIGSKPVTQILDDIKCPKNICLVGTNKESAINFLRFAVQYCGTSLKTIDLDDDNKKEFSSKFKTLFYSSINYFYKIDNSLLDVEFYCPGALVLSYGGKIKSNKSTQKGKMVSEDL